MLNHSGASTDTIIDKTNRIECASKTPFIIIVISVIIAVVTLIIDIIIPLGVAAGVPYVALVFMGLWYSRSWYIYLLACIGTILTMTGYFVSPEEGGVHWMVLSNRMLALFAIWTVALIVITSRKHAKKKLENSEQRFHDIARASTDWFWEMGPDLQFTYISDRFFKTTGIRKKTIIDAIRTPYLGFDELDHEVTQWNIHKESLEAHRPFLNFEYSVKMNDGSIRHLRTSGFPLFDPDGSFQGYRGTGTDITEQKAADLQINKISSVCAEQSARIQGIVDHVFNGIVTIDESGVIESFNPAAEIMFGYSASEVTGENVKILMPEPERSQHDSYIQNHLRLDKKKNINAALREQTGLRKNGEPFLLELALSEMFLGDHRLFIAVFIDITERKQVEKKLNYQSSRDELTGLINRSEFKRQAEHLLSTIQQGHEEHALCFIDIDQFKIINDTCGHIAGDELLRQLGQLLQNVASRRDTLARLGGDEFGVLLKHCSLEQSQRIANTIRTEIEAFQFSWEEQSFRVGVSIGLVSINKTTPNFTELLKQADAACYMAKDLGRNRIHTYHLDDVELAQRLGQMQWISGINRALEENRFCLYAQAIVPLDGSINQHYELLLRMLNEKGEIIPPGAFLPAAERYGLIERIDTWVIKNAFTLLAAHPSFVKKVHFVTINLSGPSLTNIDFLDFIISQ
ncbi:MAG: diguanylate cyclase, partial [Gammaproteobacteria bacterium]|nr:diguanylate cyclase [Gammaproteobacteria bacterium]